MNNQENVLPKLYTIQEAADRLSISRSHIYREIEAGNLQALKAGKAVRFTETELIRWVNSLKAKA